MNDLITISRTSSPSPSSLTAVHRRRPADRGAPDAECIIKQSEPKRLVSVANTQPTPSRHSIYYFLSGVGLMKWFCKKKTKRKR